jgi:tetratricopeptide (TPR) repeat protein
MKTLRKAAIAACMVLAACGRSSQKYLQKGDLYFGLGKFSDASIQYRKALQADPRSGKAYYQLGLSELKEKRYAQAHAALEQAVALLPENENAVRALAQLCLTSYLGDYRRPKELYDEIKSLSDRMLARDANSFEGLRLRGYLAMADSRVPEAVDNFRRANKVNPVQPDVVTALVQNLLQEEEYGEAEATARDFLERKKDSIPLFDVLYLHYMAQGQWEKAETTLRQKMADHPGDPGDSLELCRNLRRQGKAGAVAACLEQLTAGSAQGALFAGDFFAENGDWGEAIRRYEEGGKTHPGDLEVYRKRIIAAFIKQGKREEAGQALDAFLAGHPQDAEARGTRALLWVESRKPESIDRAVSELNQLLSANPGSAELHEKLGMALAAQSDLAAARSEFLETLKGNPASLPSLIGLAEISVRTDQFDEGLRYLAAVLSRDASNLSARLLRTACLIGTKQFAVARHELTGLATEYPQNAEAQLQLGLLDLRERHYAEADQRLRAHYKPGTGDFRTLHGMVDLDMARHQTPQAIALLQEELRQRPDSPELQALLADTAMRGGQYDVAISQYRLLAERSPRNPAILLNLGNACVAGGDYPGAVAALQQANALQPNNSEVTAILGPALEAVGRGADAEALYRSYLKAQPGDPVILNNLAYLMTSTGENLDQAQQFSEQALRSSPSRPDFLDTLAMVLLKKNNTGAALQILRNLTEKYSNNPAFRYHFGLVLSKSGSPDKAKAEFQSALTLGLPAKEAGEARKLLRQ